MTANRTTKAERRDAKRVLAAWRRAARTVTVVYDGPNLLRELRRRGVAAQARLMRPPVEQHWWFRGNVVPGACAGRLTMTADPEGDYVVKVSTGTPPPPKPEPAWTAEITFSVTDIDQSAVASLFP